MSQSAILFAYHLFAGFTVCLVLSLISARKVATQATLVSDYTGRAITTFKVDRGQYLRTWILYTATGTVAWLVCLLLWETRTYLRNAGYIG